MNILERTYNKTDTKKLDFLRKKYDITTKAEECVIRHLFERDKNRSILLLDYGDEVKERTIDGGSRWVPISATTNTSSFSFWALASELEVGNDKELWQKID